MADAIAIPQNPPISLGTRFFRLIPGVALLAVIGFAGKLLEKNINAYTKANHITFPNIEYVLWAILIGLVVSNVFGLAEIFKPGVATYEFWLKAGIVLLGSRFLLGDVAKLGGVSLLLVFVEIAGSLAFMTFLGRLFGLKPKLTSLLAVGSAVCGVSAIIATKGAIDADDEDSSFSIAAILALGAIALFSFPLIGHWLHLSDRAYGIWAGLAVDNTAEATAAFLWQKFPKFVLGFLLVSVLATVGFFTKDQNANLANLSRWAFLLTFAGVGLRTNFREMRKQGLRPFVVGFIGEVAIALFTLGLVVAAARIFSF